MSLWLQLEQAGAGRQRSLDEVLAAIPWNADGLIAAIAQQHDSGEVLMLAWMNRTALEETLRSGHVQRLLVAHLDCDGDALLLQVEQQEPACHTGRHSCFYNRLEGDRLTVASSPP